MMIYSTALRKVFLSIPQRQQVSQALTEKVRGVLYSKAIYPKPSPILNCFFTFPSEMACIMPFSMMKNHMDLYPSLKIKV